MLRAIAERDLADDGSTVAPDAAPDVAGNGASTHGAASDGAGDGDMPSGHARCHGAASERHDAEQLARLLSADVRAHGGSAVDLVIALKQAWAQIPRTDSAQRRRANERLSRMVTLCIDAYYAARGGD